jgi:hypothetical protein
MPGPYYAEAKEGNSSTSLVVGKGTLPNTDKEIVLKPKNGGLIDVITDFTWSASHVTSDTIKKMPKVMLTERRQELNSTISSALYYINAVRSAGSTLGSDALKGITTKLNSLVGGTDVSKTIANAAKDINNFIRNNAVSSEDSALLSTAEYLKSYLGIYYTKKTGMQYILPYFGDNLISIENSFGATAQEKTGVGSAIGTGQAVVNEIATTVNLTQPGSYIERPKHYQYPTEGKSVTVTFPLVNTFRRNNFIPYQQNYELLWILSFQNRPYRTSFSRIIPPKIYTLTIPGQEFFPYCYISNMQVNFNGTRRLLPISLPTGQVVQTTIPDAYTVSITFTSLLASIGNTMVSKSFASNIKTSTRGGANTASTFDVFANPFQ